MSSYRVVDVAGCGKSPPPAEGYLGGEPCRRLAADGLEFDLCHTSVLKRAIRTAHLLEIPTGVPLLYDLDRGLRPLRRPTLAIFDAPSPEGGRGRDAPTGRRG